MKARVTQDDVLNLKYLSIAIKEAQEGGRDPFSVEFTQRTAQDITRALMHVLQAHPRGSRDESSTARVDFDYV